MLYTHQVKKNGKKLHPCKNLPPYGIFLLLMSASMHTTTITVDHAEVYWHVSVWFWIGFLVQPMSRFNSDLFFSLEECSSAQSACPGGERCLEINGDTDCLPSCFVDNGGCHGDQYCVSVPVDFSVCRFGLEPCSTIKCIDKDGTHGYTGCTSYRTHYSYYTLGHKGLNGLWV